MEFPSIPRSEVPTLRGLQTVAECLRAELSPREVDHEAVAQTITGPGDDKELFDRFSALFMDAVRPPDYFALDDWLRRQLDIDVDPSALEADVRSLLAEVFILWVVMAHNLPASELGPKRAVAIALATAAEARELGTDPIVATLFEGRLNAEAGRVGDLPVRVRIRHLRAAVSCAAQLSDAVPAGVQEEVAAWQTRAEGTLAKLEGLGWFHRLVGFAPNA
ncbi:MAG: hypothetical protein AAF721_07060 [Myxococcota bacterium]